jgi:NitT/TauT family transport system permease protein
MKPRNLLVIWKDIPGRNKRILSLLSFALPILLWCAVSYLDFIWHPEVQITNPGDVAYFTKDMRVDRHTFEEENAAMNAAGNKPATGIRVNPVYLPAPHEVAISFVHAFTTPPRRAGEPWLHESLLHSIRIVFYAFLLSSIFGVPLGILCGAYRFYSKLFEPFIEFFRYLPAPAFGALAVAVLGINDGPKIAIIFIGTFFQQVLVISNTTSKLDGALIEAAQTLGGKNIKLLTHVVIPGILPDVYRDMRILLGWAWTYLIVAEVVGTSSGITWFINQQAKYRIYDNVFASIIMIGIIGLITDLILAWVGRRLFPYAYAEGEGAHG